MPGRRIYPTDNWISTTSGHGDFHELNDPHPNIAGGRQHFYKQCMTILADGREEHLRAARETYAHVHFGIWKSWQQTCPGSGGRSQSRKKSPKSSPSGSIL